MSLDSNRLTGSLVLHFAALVSNQRFPLLESVVSRCCIRNENIELSSLGWGNHSDAQVRKLESSSTHSQYSG